MVDVETLAWMVAIGNVARFFHGRAIFDERNKQRFGRFVEFGLRASAH
jgi:hypothetical protein